jgi:hypothetical protein
MTMTTTNPLKEGLLEQAQHNGTGGTSDVNQTIQTILARDETRVKRMKKLTLLAWIVWPISFLTVGVLEWLLDDELVVPVGIIVVQALLLIAVSFTISLYVRQRSLTMSQIQARLSDIERLLKHAIQDKQ